MRRQHLLRVSVGIAVVALASAARAADGPAVSPMIDGKVADWKGVTVATSETEPKASAVTQDDTFLYAYFQSADLDLARRALRGGVILWVNTGGAHAEGYGLRFRGTEAVQKAVDEAVAARDAAAAAEAPPAEQATTGRRRTWQGAGQRAPLGTLEVISGGAVNELITSGARDDGPAAACSFSGGVLAYEFRVPLAELGLPSDLLRKGGERGVAVGFQISGRTQSDRQAAATRQGGRRQRRIPPSPWSQAQQGSREEALPEEPAAAGDAGRSGGPGAASGAAGAAQGGETRRRAYPTQWYDVTLTLQPSQASR